MHTPPSILPYDYEELVDSSSHITYIDGLKTFELLIEML